MPTPCPCRDDDEPIREVSLALYENNELANNIPHEELENKSRAFCERLQARFPEKTQAELDPVNLRTFTHTIDDNKELFIYLHMLKTNPIFFPLRDCGFTLKAIFSPCLKTPTWTSIVNAIKDRAKSIYQSNKEHEEFYLAILGEHASSEFLTFLKTKSLQEHEQAQQKTGNVDRNKSRCAIS